MNRSQHEVNTFVSLKCICIRLMQTIQTVIITNCFPRRVTQNNVGLTREMHDDIALNKDHYSRGPKFA